MNNPNVTNAAALLGRVLLAAIFIISGYAKIGGFDGTAGYIASKGLPMPQVLAALTVALELGGGILLAIGFKARWVALLFFLWLIPTTFVFHKFWGIEAAQAQMQQIQFLKNLAIMGGMSYVFAFGAGAYSVDRR
jgi:putative oxidoreductase